MTIYTAACRTEGGIIFRWRLQHRKLRTAKKRRERWLHTAGRIWDVRSAGYHALCTKLAQRPPGYAVRLEGWRKLRPLAFFNSHWDMFFDTQAPGVAKDPE